jgi:hypothetical protein
MDMIGEFTSRLYWEMAPFLNWAFNHWAISLLSFFLLIRWTVTGTGQLNTSSSLLFSPSVGDPIRDLCLAFSLDAIVTVRMLDDSLKEGASKLTTFHLRCC